MDQRFAVSVSGLPATGPARLTARMQAGDGVWWRESVDLPPGPSATIDGTALIAGMTAEPGPRRGDRQSLDIGDVSRPVVTAFEVAMGGRVVARAAVPRRFGRADICPFAIRQDGVTGVFYAPTGPGPHPGVLVIGGSDGGFGAPAVAMMLADHGFATLSLAYFGVPGRPATLEGVPMETFTEAIDWMRRNPAVDPRFVAIYAESRGTEPALYAASVRRIEAVVARSPSFALWGGVSARHLPGRAAWTLGGRPLPAIPNALYPDFLVAAAGDRLRGRPVRQTPLFLEDLDRFGDTARVEIPVERIAGPLLLLAGADDQIWPSAMMAQRIEARRRRYGRGSWDQLVIYPQVGHPIPYAWLPTRKADGGGPFAVGGTAAGEARAQADAWPRIVQFLTSAADRARR